MVALVYVLHPEMRKVVDANMQRRIFWIITLFLNKYILISLLIFCTIVSFYHINHLTIHTTYFPQYYGNYLCHTCQCILLRLYTTIGVIALR